MRLAEGDQVVAIAAFRAGLAERDGIGDNDDPQPDGGVRPTGRGPASDRPRRHGRPPCTRTSSRSTTGNANPDLARKICRYLDVEPGQAEVFQFANENIFVKILDNVREKDVFLVQPTSHPVNQSIMELLIMIDAFKRASAGRITAVVPYYAYGRSDKKDQPRVPITARLIADMITVAGADRVLTMDLHQGQIQGFFNIPVDELTAVHILVELLHATSTSRTSSWSRTSGSPSAPGRSPSCSTRRSRSSRSAAIGNLDRAELMNVIGEVRGKRAIIVDDEIDTGRDADRDGPGPRARGRRRDLCLRHPRRAVRPGRRSDRDLEPAEVILTDTVPLPPAKRIAEDQDALDRAAHRRGDQADPSRRVRGGAVLAARSPLTQEMLLWEDGDGTDPRSSDD